MSDISRFVFSASVKIGLYIQVCSTHIQSHTVKTGKEAQKFITIIITWLQGPIVYYTDHEACLTAGFQSLAPLPG